jgi:photosystem II stability/assembly factor-like uncharacterized protein
MLSSRVIISIALLGGPAPLIAQWTQTPAPSGGTITAFAVCRGFLFAGAASDGVYRSDDDGTSWTVVSTGLTNTGVWTLAVVDTVLYAGTNGGGVFRSNDAGATWTAASDGLTNLYALSLTSDGTSLYTGTIGGVYRSDDGGMGWTLKDNGLTTVSVRSMAFIGNSLFAGTYGGGIFVSTDQGEHWSGASAGLTNLSILNFTHIGATVFAGTYGGMYYSTNAGANWKPMSLDSYAPEAPVAADSARKNSQFQTPLDIAAPKAVYSLAVTGTDLFVGTYGGGVHKSTDGGKSWTDVSTGLGDLFLNLIGVENSYLYAGTLGGEIWRRRLSEITGVDTRRPEPPQAFTLVQNFPNPFNPETVIGYEIPRTCQVRLVVYDALGREVALLVNGRREAGSYTVHFQAGALSSGVYLCRLEAGGFSQTRKMILVR